MLMGSLIFLGIAGQLWINWEWMKAHKQQLENLLAEIQKLKKSV